MKYKDSITFIFPCYNEEENIECAINSALNSLRKLSNDYEVIVVNDGSTDSSQNILNSLKLKYPQLSIINQKNKGYGGALKSGFAKASKDWMFFSDSDLQFDYSEIEKLLQYIDSKKFIFGYRINRKDSLHRKLIAKLLKIWNYFFFQIPLEYKDIDCAFKLMNRASFQSLPTLQSEGAMISTELIMNIIKSGEDIKQVGVNHYPRLNGTSSGGNWRVILKAVYETFKLLDIMKKNEQVYSKVKLINELRK